MDAKTSSRPAEAKSLSGGRAAVVRAFGESPSIPMATSSPSPLRPDGSLWSVEEPGVLRNWDCGERQPASTGTPWAVPKTSGLSAWTPAPWPPPVTTCPSGSRHGRAAGHVLTQPSWVTAVAFRLAPSTWRPATTTAWFACGTVVGLRLLNEFALARRAGQRRGLQRGREPAGLGWRGPDHRRVGSEQRPVARQAEGHTDRIPALAWHPEGDRLVSAGWDTTARVWDTSTFQPIILLNSHAGQVHDSGLQPGRRPAGLCRFRQRRPCLGSRQPPRPCRAPRPMPARSAASPSARTEPDRVRRRGPASSICDPGGMRTWRRSQPRLVAPTDAAPGTQPGWHAAGRRGQ